MVLKVLKEPKEVRDSKVRLVVKEPKGHKELREVKDFKVG